MRKLIIVILFIVFLGGCASSSLLRAIEKTGREGIEVLYQNSKTALSNFGQ